jgi:hypothetical protein
MRACAGVEFDTEHLTRRRLAGADVGVGVGVGISRRLAGVSVGLRGSRAGVRDLLSASRPGSGRPAPVPYGRMPEMSAPELCHPGK